MIIKKVLSSSLLTLFLATCFFYLPIFAKPSIILDKPNDLREFFWPVIYFVRSQILEGHLPFWNNLFLSGTPLLPDPQSPIFYLPNIIFLLLPLDLAFLISLFLHTFMAGVGFYLCSKLVFKFREYTSILLGILYLSSTQIANFLEAGHFGLVTSYAWIPLVFLATFKIVDSKKASWIFLYSFALAAIYLTHTITFFIALVFSVLVFIVFIFDTPYEVWTKKTLKFLTGLLICLGLICIVLLPQLEWSRETTRFLLLKDRDVYPKWISEKEFLTNVIIPWVSGLWNIETEKWIAIGISPILLAAYGFFKVKNKLKVLFIFISLIIFLVALNNVSPIYKFLLSLDFFVLARVTTRIWVIFSIIVFFLVGAGFENLNKRFGKKVYILSFLLILETLYLSWFRIYKPVLHPANFAPIDVIRFLNKDTDKFRILCLTRCISQKDAAIYNLELVDGYNTVQQVNYYQKAWQLTNSYWNYYTLSIPPIGLYTFKQIQPDANSLGGLNTKYVISPYALNDANFQKQIQYGNFIIYRNLLYKPRAYYRDGKNTPTILAYLPNFIRIDTSNKDDNKLILAEIYSKGWKASLNGASKAEILETPNSLRLINLKSDTYYVDLIYQPNSFVIGATITILTFMLIIFLLLKRFIYLF